MTTSRNKDLTPPERKALRQAKLRSERLIDEVTHG